MPTAEQIHEAIRNVTDQSCFINGLLRDTLNWQIPDGIENIEDMAYVWSADDLRGDGLNKKLVDGKVLQIQPLEGNQQWGIFLLEFKNVDTFVKGRGLTGPLRKVLRGLVRKKRQQANLPTWERENLLFICTHNYEHYCFAYFKSPKDTKLAPLSTFGWSKGDTAIHTLCEYNLLNLVWSDDPAQPQWRAAFDLEKVTKGFFSQIAVLFTQLVGGKRKVGSKTQDFGKGSLGFPSPDDTDRKEFAVRLIGRLVFCWFLKKKRSKQGLNLLPEELLSREALNKNKEYYHNVLEPLFFEVLNTPIDTRDKRFAEAPWARIPFLNGGLFTPHDDDCYPNHKQQRAQYRNMLSVPDDWLRELLSVFETYNFTIDENTPVDVELAIEPEMLGRIFENLLAEINPETGKTARKATGSYYTPRPIVEYMVDESLKQYLLTKTGLPEEKIFSLLSYSDENTDLTETQKDSVLDALDTIKIIDPACGSGAFPMGILQKILLVLGKLDPDSKKWVGRILSRIDDVTFKKDLERKLKRESLEYVHKLGIIRDAIYGVDIQPIAVEIAKLRCFLSLIVDETIDDTQPNRGVEPLPNLEFKFVCANSLIGLGGDMLPTNQALRRIDELKQVRQEYLNTYGKEKKDLENKFLTIRSELSRLALDWQEGSEKALKLADWNPFSDESCGWFDPEWMFGTQEGFDIVIANPPYVSYYSRQSAKTRETSRMLRRLRRDYEFASYERKTGRLNLWMFFVEKFVRLLREGGVTAFIVDVNFTKDLAKNIRKFLIENTLVKQFVHDLSEFEFVASGQIVIIAQKAPDAKNNQILVRGGLSEAGTHIKQSEIGRPNYHILTSGRDAIIAKLLRKNCLGDIPAIRLTTGVQVGGVESYKGKTVKEHFYRRDWDFKKIFPSVEPKSILRYSRPVPSRGLLFDYELASEITASTNKSAVVLRKYCDFLNREKVFIRQSAAEVLATLGAPGTCGEYSLFSLMTDSVVLNLRYVLALLNSKLYTYFAVKCGIILMKKGTQPQIRKSGLQKLPIAMIPTSKQEAFADPVDKILAITHSDDFPECPASQAQVRHYYDRINEMVYKLYGLTNEEIAIVEGHGKAD